MQAAGLSSRSPIAFAPLPAFRGRAPCRRRPFVGAQAAESRPSGEQSIEGLPASYCDEFVCTSSPAVEASVRTLAKDLQRANGKWAPIYASEYKYEDPYRRFKGPEGIQRLDFVPTNVADAKVTISQMRMLDNSAAEIRWRLTGRLGPLPIDVAGTTEIGLNLLTGRIERQSERWDLSACSPPAAAAWNAARALWAAKQASSDASAAAGQVLDTLTSVDDDEQYSAPNPNDPGRFFQQKDTFKQDALFFVGVLLLFWAIAQAWFQLFSPPSGGFF